MDYVRLVAYRDPGAVPAEEIDEWVQRWHAAPIGSQTAQVDLYEHLGMTWDQYQRWAATGEIPTL